MSSCEDDMIYLTLIRSQISLIVYISSLIFLIFHINIHTKNIIGTESTWQYPSPQMFYNALVRKNKVEGALPEDMESVVAIHNNMNENTWKQVMYWEELHQGLGPTRAKELKKSYLRNMIPFLFSPERVRGEEPKLLKFIGRPHDLSPLARFKHYIFNHPLPFDRHDWTVDRGGTLVRYIIDYYHDEAAIEQDVKPRGLHDTTR
jgi:cytochrome c heme-lyase